MTMSASRIRKNDTVIAIAGEGVGKTGRVLEVLPSRGRVLVEGLGMVKKTLRKSQDAPQGGIVEKASPLALSNVMLYCPACKKGVRIAIEREGGRPVRKCRKCAHVFEG